MLRQPPHRRLPQSAQGKAQPVELRGRRCKQEIALILRSIRCPVQFRAIFPVQPLHIMARHQRFRAQIVGHLQQVAKFHRLVAGDAGNRGAAPQIGVRKFLHHFGAKRRGIVEHIMGKAHGVGHMPRV